MLLRNLKVPELEVDLLVEALEYYAGPRCPDDYEKGCPTCDLWHQWDMLLTRAGVNSANLSSLP